MPEAVIGHQDVPVLAAVAPCVAWAHVAGQVDRVEAIQVTRAQHAQVLVEVLGLAWAGRRGGRRTARTGSG